MRILFSLIYYKLLIYHYNPPFPTKSRIFSFLSPPPSVWIFTYENGRLIFSNIDEGANSLEYIDMMKQVPKIEDALELYDAANSTKL